LDFNCVGLIAGAQALGDAHTVKVDVRLVSFPLSGVRNDYGSNRDQSITGRRPLLRTLEITVK
jgi:hypothetical protein